MIVGARFSLLAVMGTLLLLSLCWSSLPVLDEESYWAIARELNPLRPYDWELRWPPIQAKFVHPRILLAFCGICIQRLGASLVLTKAITSVILGL